MELYSQKTQSHLCNLQKANLWGCKVLGELPFLTSFSPSPTSLAPPVCSLVILWTNRMCSYLRVLAKIWTFSLHLDLGQLKVSLSTPTPAYQSSFFCSTFYHFFCLIRAHVVYCCQPPKLLTLLDRNIDLFFYISVSNVNQDRTYNEDLSNTIDELTQLTRPDLIICQNAGCYPKVLPRNM